MFGKSKMQPTKLGFDELLDRKRQLDLEIAARQDTELDSLKSKVMTVANALGITVGEMFGIKGEVEPRRRKQTPRIKYHDPDQPQNTWTGKGKPPKWMQERLEQGATKEQFQIQ